MYVLLKKPLFFVVIDQITHMCSYNMLSALSFLERGTFMQIANSHNGFVYNAELLAPPPPYGWVTGTRIALNIT